MSKFFVGAREFRLKSPQNLIWNLLESKNKPFEAIWKWPYFGQKKAFLSNFWHWTPKILQYMHKFCWCMGFQVKISIGFDGEGFWVQKSSPKLKFRFWSCFGPLDQFFSPKLPPNKDWPCCGPPYVTLLGIWIVKYAHSDNLKMLTSNEPN